MERGTEPGKGARKEGREEGMGGVGVGGGVGLELSVMSVTGGSGLRWAFCQDC